MEDNTIVEVRNMADEDNEHELDDEYYPEEGQLGNIDDFHSANGQIELILRRYETISIELSNLNETINKQKIRVQEILKGDFATSTEPYHSYKQYHSLSVSLKHEGKGGSEFSTKTENDEIEATTREKINKDQVEDVDCSKKSYFRSLIKPFLESSTLHGMPRLADSCIWVRLFWIFALIGAVTALTIQILGLTEDYLNFGVVTDVAVKQGNVTLPVITVCNDRPFLASKLVKLPIFSNLSADIRDPKNARILSESLYQQYDGLELEDLLHLGANVEDSLAVNIYPNEETTQMMVLPYHGSCYTIKFPPETTFIELAFNLHINDSISPVNSVPGLSVYLKDDQHAYPFYEPVSEIMVNGGEEKGAEISHRVISRLNGSYNKCQDNVSAFHDRTGITYEQDACLRECEFKAALSNCHCLLRNKAYFPFWIEHTRRKRNTYPNCKVDTKSDCVAKLNRNPPKCKCKPKCNVKLFETVDRGSDPLENINCIKNPKHILCKLVSKWVPPNVTEEWFTTNIAAVRLGMTQKTYKTYKQKPEYPFLRFMSDIGGSMGFYLGASMLTYYEVVHFGIFTVLYACKNIWLKFLNQKTPIVAEKRSRSDV